MPTADRESHGGWTRGAGEPAPLSVSTPAAGGPGLAWAVVAALDLETGDGGGQLVHGVAPGGSAESPESAPSVLPETQ